MSIVFIFLDRITWTFDERAKNKLEHLYAKEKMLLSESECLCMSDCPCLITEVNKIRATGYF